MNENVIWVILPLAISGLGFLAYKHPNFTLAILGILFIVGLICYGVLETVSDAKVDSYSKCIKAMAETSIYKGDDSQAAITGFSWDSVLISDPMLESFSAVYNSKTEEGNKLAKATVVSHAIGLTKKKVREQFEQLIEKEQKNLGVTKDYFLWAGIGCSVLIIMCILFDKLSHTKEKKNDKSTDSDTPQEIF